jgi:hypothetical protein
VGIPVNWTEAAGTLAFADGGMTVSDGNGLAAIAVTTGPLAAGEQAAGMACAFANVCGSFTVSGVDPSQWVLTAVEGQVQSIEATGILQPVAIQVTDGAGHPVIGAPVTVYQTVSGFQVCPAEGRCPVAPVYETSQASAVSDKNGLIVVVPKQLTGMAETTTIAAAAGTQGFLSMTLQKQP